MTCFSAVVVLFRLFALGLLVWTANRQFAWVLYAVRAVLGREDAPFAWRDVAWALALLAVDLAVAWVFFFRAAWLARRVTEDADGPLASVGPRTLATVALRLGAIGIAWAVLIRLAPWVYYTVSIRLSDLPPGDGLSQVGIALTHELLLGAVAWVLFAKAPALATMVVAGCEPPETPSSFR